MNFTAIDFETATGRRDSACAVGIVVVEGGEIADRFYSLIQPPNNYYWRKNIRIHGIRPSDTLTAPTFEAVYPELRSRLRGRVVVAHNETFDRSVLRRAMEYYGLWYGDLDLPDRWECTLKIYRRKGFRPCKLSDCCRCMGIDLNHHEALSDAMACAQLYLRR